MGRGEIVFFKFYDFLQTKSQVEFLFENVASVTNI